MDDATRCSLIRENEAAENTKIKNRASTIEENVIEKGQTNRVVFNLEDWKGNINQLNEYLIEGSEEVLVVQDGKVISIYP